jgi:hypothetical protein
LSACASPAPKIGRGLPSNFEAASRVFDERVKARFPTGSSEALLMEELKSERFKVTKTVDPKGESSFSATREGAIWPVCGLAWNIHWTERAGRILRIDGDYGETGCL